MLSRLMVPVLGPVIVLVWAAVLAHGLPPDRADEPLSTPGTAISAPPDCTRTRVVPADVPADHLSWWPGRVVPRFRVPLYVPCEPAASDLREESRPWRGGPRPAIPLELPR